MSGDLSLSFTAISLLMWVMLWLLGMVRNLLPVTEGDDRSSQFVVPALLYGAAVLVGFVGLIYVSYIILPRWSSSVLAHLGWAMFIVQSIIIVAAPAIVGLMTNENRKVNGRKMMTIHGLGTFWLLWLALVVQFFVDTITRWSAATGQISGLIASSGSALVVFLLYAEFMWMLGRRLNGSPPVQAEE
jgi:hypothetical protein